LETEKAAGNASGEPLPAGPQTSLVSDVLGPWAQTFAYQTGPEPGRDRLPFLLILRKRRPLTEPLNIDLKYDSKLFVVSVGEGWV
jgi:hypothetical protein